MPVRAILVVIDPGSDIETLLDAALGVARRMEGHLEVLYLRPDVAELSARFSLPGCPLPIAELTAANERSHDAMIARFEAWRELRRLPAEIVKSMLASTFARWSSWDGPPIIGLLRRARLADLVVTAMQAQAGLAASLVDAALFDSGRPVLLMPTDVRGPLLERVAVAWNSSLESVRSLSAAVPFLHEAERVQLLALASPHPENADPSMITIDEVAEALSWKGIHAGAVHVEVRNDEPAGAALLREADARGISLLALGAFTRSRVSGTALGGVTGYVLEHAKIPLLMTH